MGGETAGGRSLRQPLTSEGERSSVGNPNVHKPAPPTDVAPEPKRGRSPCGDSVVSEPSGSQRDWGAGL